MENFRFVETVSKWAELNTYQDTEQKSLDLNKLNIELEHLLTGYCSKDKRKVISQGLELIKQGAEPNRILDFYTIGETTILNPIVEEDDVESLKIAIDLGCRLTKDTEDRAIGFYSHKCIDLLIEKGLMKVNRECGKSYSVCDLPPLLHACAGNPCDKKFELVKTLIDRGADVFQRSSHSGMDALDFSIHFDDNQVAEYLLSVIDFKNNHKKNIEEMKYLPANYITGFVGGEEYRKALESFTVSQKA